MTQKYFLPFLAICGALLGLFIVFWTQRTVPTPPIPFPPPKSPYVHSIAAAGIIEASSENIAIGTPFTEIVTQVYVKEGDVVQAGQPLFELDKRALIAQKMLAQANLAAAEVSLEDKKQQFSFYQRLNNLQAVSEQIYTEAKFAYLEAQESVRISKANLAIIETDLEKSTICSPIDGEILQVNIHKGEIASVTPAFSSQSSAQSVSQGSLILMGNLNPMQVRINIDEDDAWRYQKGSPAEAFIRGNSNIHFPLTFAKLEPYIIPKSSFTGQTTERVDTRVLQVLYHFEKKQLPVYVGQILDIYIESPPYPIP